VYQLKVPASAGFVGLWAMVGSRDWQAREDLDTTLYIVEVIG